MAAYGSIVLGGSYAVRRWATPGVSTGTALKFSAASNITGLLLVLLPREAQPERVLTRHVDWVETLSVLGIVGSMVGISFLFARHRTSS